jgi:carbonic anhydrase
VHNSTGQTAAFANVVGKDRVIISVDDQGRLFQIGGSDPDHLIYPTEGASPLRYRRGVSVHYLNATEPKTAKTIFAVSTDGQLVQTHDIDGPGKWKVFLPANEAGMHGVRFQSVPTVISIDGGRRSQVFLLTNSGRLAQVSDKNGKWNLGFPAERTGAEAERTGAEADGQMRFRGNVIACPAGQGEAKYLYVTRTDGRVVEVTDVGGKWTLRVPAESRRYMNVQDPVPEIEQSPIEVKASDTGFGPDIDPYPRWIRRQWKPDLSGKLEGTPGHYKIVFPVPDSGFIWLGEKKYFIESFHIHIPGEHRIDGTIAPVELHIVHKTLVDDCLAVVGIAFKSEPGAETEAEEPEFFGDLIKGISGLAANAEPFPIPTNPERLLPKDPTQYYWYQGSLTSPPYGENVSWLFMKNPTLLKQTTIDALNQYRGTARPLQPRYRRLVLRNFM